MAFPAGSVKQGGRGPVVVGSQGDVQVNDGGDQLGTRIRALLGALHPAPMLFRQSGNAAGGLAIGKHRWAITVANSYGDGETLPSEIAEFEIEDPSVNGVVVLSWDASFFSYGQTPQQFYVYRDDGIGFGLVTQLSSVTTNFTDDGSVPPNLTHPLPTVDSSYNICVYPGDSPTSTGAVYVDANYLSINVALANVVTDTFEIDINGGTFPYLTISQSGVDFYDGQDYGRTHIDSGDIFFMNTSGAGSAGIGVSPSSENLVPPLLLPLAKGNSGQLLSTDGGTPEQLAWVDSAGGSSWMLVPDTPGTAGQILSTLGGSLPQQTAWITGVPPSVAVQPVGSQTIYGAFNLAFLSAITGEIAGATSDINGSGYSVGDTGLVVGGDGTAAYRVDSISASVASSSVFAGGSGYAPDDNGTVNGGNNAHYQVDTVDGSGGVLTFHWLAPGLGYATGNYSTGDTVGTGSGFQVGVVAASTGAVATLTITAIGSGYSVATGVATTVSTGGGDGAFTMDITVISYSSGAGLSRIYINPADPANGNAPTIQLGTQADGVMLFGDGGLDSRGFFLTDTPGNNIFAEIIGGAISFALGDTASNQLTLAITDTGSPPEKATTLQIRDAANNLLDIGLRAGVLAVMLVDHSFNAAWLGVDSGSGVASLTLISVAGGEGELVAPADAGTFSYYMPSNSGTLALLTDIPGDPGSFLPITLSGDTTVSTPIIGSPPDGATFSFYGGHAAPDPPTVGQVGTPGSSVWGYSVALHLPTGDTLLSAETQIATGNLTLDTDNYNTITVPSSAIPGAKMAIYQTTTPTWGSALQGVLAVVDPGATYNHQGAMFAIFAPPPSSDKSVGLYVDGSIATSGEINSIDPVYGNQYFLTNDVGGILPGLAVFSLGHGLTNGAGIYMMTGSLGGFGGDATQIIFIDSGANNVGMGSSGGNPPALSFAYGDTGSKKSFSIAPAAGSPVYGSTAYMPDGGLGTLGLWLTPAPATSSSYGMPGMYSYDSGYFYWCYSPNAWCKVQRTFDSW
jgi:hypothetical protein